MNYEDDPIAKIYSDMLQKAKSEEERVTYLLLEYQQYQNIPKTKTSYREDSENSNNKTKTHSHVYACRNGKGKQLYAINNDGSGHDGSSGIEIPKKHADFFRAKGYEIPSTNILEQIEEEEGLTYLILEIK